MVVTSVIVGSICLVLIVTIRNYYSTLVFILIFGMTYSPRSLSYVYVNELTTKKHETLYSTMCMISDSLSMLIIGCYFWVFKNMDGLIFFLITA